MYAVIMAGGGGTRLHPLSRPELPKPFLPLVSSRSLLQAAVDRVTDLVGGRVWVVADGRYRRLVEDQAPDARLLAEPMARNTAAAIALATLAIDEPEDEVMVVLPADQAIDDDTRFRAVLRAAERLARGSFELDSPLVTLGVQHGGRPATEYGYLVPKGPGTVIDGLSAYHLQGFEEKPDLARAEELVRQPGVAWNAGMFLWRRRAIRAALERHTGFIQTLGPMIDSPAMLERAYESIQRPLSIDHAVMEGSAARGQVVMGAMEVGWSDLGSWTALLGAIDAHGTGLVVKAGETVEVSTDDLVIRRTDGRLGVISPIEPGRMTAVQPIAVLRSTARDRAKVEALLERCADAERVA